MAKLIVISVTLSAETQVIMSLLQLSISTCKYKKGILIDFLGKGLLLSVLCPNLSSLVVLNQSNNQSMHLCVARWLY